MSKLAIGGNIYGFFLKDDTGVQWLLWEARDSFKGKDWLSTGRIGITL